MRRTFLFDHGMPTRNLSLVILVLGALLLWLTYPPSLGQAQVAPITPSGLLNTQVSGPIAVGGKTQYDITGGTRPGGGTNLFHSFGDFNVPTNNIANFLNTPVSGVLPPTSNILARVTGTTGNNPTLSSIYGTIQTTNFPGANLFLMNPAGFLFGPNATVNVGGMMTFTTADYLRLAEINGTKGIFHADTQLTSILTAAPVVAFGFLGSNPAAIAIQGSTLTVQPGQSISLVGGNQGFNYTDPDTGASASVPGGVTITGGRLSAPGGQINLASVASAGEVLQGTMEPAPNINGSSFTAMGNISLSQGALLDVSANAAGTVRIRSGALVIDNATISADTVNADGAPISLDINVTGDLSISDSRGVSAITARTTGLGNAGEVLITATNLTATSSARSVFAPINTHFALIDTHTSGRGTAGNVSIETTGNLNVTGPPTGLNFIDSGTIGFDGGHGGDVTMTGKNIQLSSALISTGDFVAQQASPFESAGSGGNVTITADTLTMTLSVIATDGFWAGRAGDLTLNVRNIDLNTGSALSLLEFEGGGKLTINADRLIADFSQIDSETVLGPGGGITITANVVELKNGTTLRSQTQGDGNAGDILITATDHLTLADRFTTDPNDPTTVGARARPTGLFTNALGESGFGDLGNAGSIIVTTPRLEITGGARINSTTQSSGLGGDVVITAPTLVTISGERPTEVTEEGLFGVGSTRASGIYTRTVGSEFCTGACGDAGHVSITTGSLSLSSGAVLNSGTTNAGHGGDITVHSTDTISISGTMADGTPGGIFSQTVGTEPGSGNGGTIDLHAGQFEVMSGAQISASSLGSGNAGNVILQGPSSPAQSILIDGSGSGIFTNTQGTGAGGNIVLNANSVTLQNGGTLSAATSGTAPSARGGNVTVTGDSLTVASGGRIEASTSGAGNGGAINITTSGDVTVSGVSADGQTRSGLFAKTQTSGSGTGGGGGGSGGGSGGGGSGAAKPGNAGNITVNAKNLLLNDGAQIDSSTTSGGAGGSVAITTTENITIAGSNTRLTSDATRGDGKGGSITLLAKNITVHDHASVTAATGGKGDAGNVTLTALDQLLLQSAGTVTTSTSGSGKGGTITIQAGQVMLDGPGTGITADTLHPFADLTITINILHANDGDLVVQIDSPTGTRVALLSRVGGAGDNFTNTKFNDQAATAITGTAPFTGTFKPREPLAQLNNELVAGNWTLNVKDQATGNVGTLQNWTLQIGSQTFQSTGVPKTIPDPGNVRSTITVANPTAPTVPGVGEAPGIGGNVTVNAGTVTVQNGATMSATSRGSGKGGIVTVNATGPVALSGAGSGIFTETEGSGAGGSIFVNANSVTLQNGSTMSAKTTSSGNAGDILVKADSVNIESGAQLTSSSVQRPPLFEGEEVPLPTGNAGNITIQGLTGQAQSVVIDGGGSGIFTNTRGTGAGGNIVLNANSVTLQNGGTLSAATSGTEVTATGGNITLTAGQSVSLSNEASISASSTGPGNTGNIQINAGNQFAMRNSMVTTEANQSSGGLIKITTNPSGTVQLTNSTISASVLDGTGGGGSVNIDPQFVILQNSKILARAVQGPGGNIFITTNLLLPDANSVISASSQFGVNGTVTIQSPNAPGGGEVQPLGQTPLQATSLLNQRCAALAGGEFSSFTVAGRDSLPTEPGGWLSSPLAALGAGTGLQARGEGQESMALGASLAGETAFLSLRQIAPAGFLTQAFAVDGSVGCQS